MFHCYLWVILWSLEIARGKPRTHRIRIFCKIFLCCQQCWRERGKRVTPHSYGKFLITHRRIERKIQCSTMFLRFFDRMSMISLLPPSWDSSLIGWLPPHWRFAPALAASFYRVENWLISLSRIIRLLKSDLGFGFLTPGCLQSTLIQKLIFQ